MSDFRKAAAAKDAMTERIDDKKLAAALEQTRIQGELHNKGTSDVATIQQATSGYEVDSKKGLYSAHSNAYNSMADENKAKTKGISIDNSIKDATKDKIITNANAKLGASTTAATNEQATTLEEASGKKRDINYATGEVGPSLSKLSETLKYPNEAVDDTAKPAFQLAASHTPYEDKKTTMAKFKSQMANPVWDKPIR